MFCDVPLLRRLPAPLQVGCFCRICWKGPVILVREIARFKSHLLGKFWQMLGPLLFTCQVNLLPESGRW